MRKALAGALLAVAAGLVLGGCGLQRKNYEAVSLGMGRAQVRQILGAPRYEFADEWVYTRDDPRDLTKVSIRFAADGTVAGRSWQNPERPWENHRENGGP